MDKEINESRESYLERELNQLKEMLNGANTTIRHQSDELIFWKKLALSNLGVDSHKIEELVRNSGYGLGNIGGGMAALKRNF